MSELKIQSGGMQNGIFENGQLAFGNAPGAASYICAYSQGAVAHGQTYGENSYIKAVYTGAVAHGYAFGENSYIYANAAGAVAGGYTNYTGSCIYVEGYGAVAHGFTTGVNSSIKTYGHGAVAHGCTFAKNSYIYATGHGSIAHGQTYGENSYIESYGDGAVAHGYAHQQNSYINASAFGSEAHGYTAGENSYIMSNGSGAIAHGCTAGENSYIMSNSSGAIAHGYTDGKNSYIYANGPGADAGGYTVGEGSCIEAIGYGSGAYGYAKNATKEYLVDNNEEHSKINNITGSRSSIIFNTFGQEVDYYKRKKGHIIQINDSFYQITSVANNYGHITFNVSPSLRPSVNINDVVYDVTNCHIAHGDGSFVFGRNLFAYVAYEDSQTVVSQTVVGQYNMPDRNALFIVGCGTSKDKRKNAFTVDIHGACRGRSMNVPCEANPNVGLSPNGDYALYSKSSIGNASTFFIQGSAERIFINYRHSHSQDTRPQIFLSSGAYQPGDIFTIINTVDLDNNIYNFHGKDGSAGKFTAIDNSTFAFMCTQKTFSVNVSTANDTVTLDCRGWVELAHG